MLSRPLCLLFDNGSLRPASTLNLRAVAVELQEALPDMKVRAVSLLHSSAVPAEQLGGEPAKLLELAVVEALEESLEREIVLLPFFFGPSAALTEYVPERIAAIFRRFPQARVRLAPALCDPSLGAEPRVVQALLSNLRHFLVRHGLVRPAVVLVDHGSPQRGVARVRDQLAEALKGALGDEVCTVVAASMERRPGPEYAFNEPLLAKALTDLGAGEVVVLLQFLSPGRHAGPEGDIAQICAEARASQPQLRTWITDTIGQAPELLPLLVERAGQGRWLQPGV